MATQKKKTVSVKTLGGRIRKIRGVFTQREFAEMLSINQAMVSKYELNEATPSPKVLLRIARFGNTSMEWLLTGRGEGEAIVSDSTAEDHITALADILREGRTPGIDEYSDMMRDTFRDRTLRLEMLSYYQFLKFVGDE